MEARIVKLESGVSNLNTNLSSLNSNFSTLNNRILGAFIAGLLVVVATAFGILNWMDGKFELQAQQNNSHNEAVVSMIHDIDLSISSSLARLEYNNNKNDKP